MAGNTFGKILTMTSFGESHGEAMGVVIDGVPPQLDFNLENLQEELDRRAPGKIKGTTSRVELDKAKVLSGIFENKTLGTPIAVMVQNTNQRSSDYNKIKDNYRVGHADKTYMDKYGIRDHRGGGRASGRETIARVIGGYFASLILKDIYVRAYVSKLGPFKFDGEIAQRDQSNWGKYHFPKGENEKEIEKFLLDLQRKGESVGGVISIIVDDCMAGLGEPAFDKLKADLAKALLSIGACVSFSFGLGEKMSDMLGSEVSQSRKNFGGIEGGISNGERIFLSLTFKPTSTVGKNAKEGRHDPCIMPRAIPVVEAMVKFVLADHYLRYNAYKN